MKKILIFTDNLPMYEKFVEVISQKNLDKLHNFEYACTPSNSLFLNVERVKELSIQKEADRLIEKYDLIISCHSKQIFPPEIVNNVRCINIHPGLNPYNRGWFPQVFSILNKMPLGATIHEMDEEIDHGNIIVQKSVEVYDWDTSISAYNRVLEAEVELLKECMEDLIENSYNAESMREEGNYNSKKDFNALCELDLNETLTMRECLDRLRALTHGEYKNAYFFDNHNNKIFVSLTLEKDEHGK